MTASTKSSASPSVQASANPSIPASASSCLSTLPIVETFHSVQGEGFWSGRSAFFIRLAGCDVGCPWCDTKHSWSVASHGRREISELVAEATAVRPFMVVITGGEPLMQDLSELTAALHQAGLRIHLETSGSYPLTGQFDWISLSPKVFKPPLANIYAQVNELKVVIDQPSDFVWAESEAQKVPPSAVRLLQPQWNSDLGQQHVFDYVLSHSEWRVGLQMHKYLGVR